MIGGDGPGSVVVRRGLSTPTRSVWPRSSSAAFQTQVRSSSSCLGYLVATEYGVGIRRMDGRLELSWGRCFFFFSCVTAMELRVLASCVSGVHAGLLLPRASAFAEGARSSAPPVDRQAVPPLRWGVCRVL